MIDSEQAKQQLRNVLGEGGDDPDYAGLHQGKDGTKLRHDTVIELMRPHMKHGYRLLDWGCGTALLLKSISEAKLHLPSYYVGVDFIDQRRGEVEARLKELGVPGKFIVAENPKGFYDEWNGMAYADIVTAIGIMGYPGIHTMKKIRQVIRDMRDLAPAGAVTVPNHMTERLGEAEMARYGTEDVKEFIANNGVLKIKEIHTDTVVYW